jgi:hypothetical protein
VGGTTDQISVENFSKFITAYSAHTGSAGNTFTGPQIINNNVTINGKLTVFEVVAQYETASILFSTGSTKLGDEITDRHEFTGSTNITGSVFINGQNYTLYSSSNSTVFTNFSSSNSTYNTTFSSSNSSYNTTFSSSNSSYNTTFSSSNAAYVTALSSSNSNYNTTFSSSNAAYVTELSSSNSSYNTTFSSSNSTTITTISSSINSTINALGAGTDSQLARLYQTTASIQTQTASLLAFTASQDSRNFVISEFTASTNNHIVGISTFTSSQYDTMARVYQTTSSLQSTTASLLVFTASQDSRNLTLSTVTGSLIGITNGLMAFTAALDNTYATDAQLYELYQATQSLELHSGSIIGITNELMALTASMKAQSIVSSSTQISNYYKFAETASANTNFYGGLTVTDYSKFGKSGISKALDVFGGVSVTGSVTTQANSIGGFIGNFYTQWDSFGSQGGDGNASVGYFVGTFNDDRKLRLLSDADILLTTGINKKIQVAKASVGTSKVEITGSFNVTGSSTTVGNFEVLNGNMIGSLLATNNVVSSSTQISNYYKFAETASANTTFYGGIKATEYSNFGKSGLAKSVDFQNAIAVTGSVTTQANSIGGFIGNFYTQWDSFGSQGGDGNASVGYFVGTFNDDRKLRLLSDADILLTHGINKKIQVAKASVGTSKVEITGSFNVTGSSTTVGNFEVLNGSIIGSVLATNNVLSSSQQIQNYFTFARTGSANTFYGNQTVIGNMTATRLLAGGPTNESTAVAIGTDALSSNSGTYVVGIGLNSLQNNQSANNTGIGPNTLQSNTTGQGNVAINTNALISNKSGSFNIGIGVNAIANAHGASNNTAVGHASLTGNITGFSNAAFGSFALTNNITGIANSAFGSDSMINAQTGNYNVAIGSSAGGNNTNGSNNTFLGYGAGATTGFPSPMTSVNESIYVGYMSRGLAATGTTNEIVIGNNAFGLGSNTTVLGNTSTALTQIYGAVTATGGITGSLMATNGVVSSSAQIQNYNLFAQTSSANIFYNYQAISGSKLELHTSDANGGLVINSKATATQTFITLLDRGSNDNSIVATFEDTNGANQLGGLSINAGRKDNQAGLILRGKNKVANSGAVNGYITSVIGNAYSDNALTTLTTGVTGKSISFLGQDTELANLNFNGDLTITNGNLVVASGKGIDFSATANSTAGTMASELLNDYEEGTWTPVITDLTNDATMDGTYTRGSYIKIGKQVTVRGYILTTSLGSVTGNVKIKGLPFTNGGGFASLGGGSIGTASGLNITAGHSVHISTPLGQNHLGLNVGDDATGTTEMTAAEWSADGQIQMLATYFVD